MQESRGQESRGPEASEPEPSDQEASDRVVPVDRRGRRTHPLTGVVQGALWAGAVVVAIGTSYFNGNGWGNVPWWAAAIVTVVGGLALGEAAGFLGWWFTRYVIDDTELRIDRGIFTKTSRRIPFERIQSVDIAQPFIARLAGLAELRIDMAGGDESRSVLRLLAIADARATRRLLLELAHGRSGVTDDAPTNDTETLIAHVPPARVVIGALLSLDLLAAIGALLILALAAIGISQPLVLLGGIIPVASWAVQIVGKRVVTQWDFALHRTPRGLRIERGLFSRTSQTIPFARVQGVAVDEPIVWRRFGWRRLEVDVAGYAAHASDDITATSSTLLPIADRALSDAVVSELTGAELTGAGIVVPRTRVPRRGAWFAPIGWRFRWIGADDRVAVSGTGWLTRRTNVVPHARAQSVALRQGPVQRRLGVATVELHSPDGPVDVDAHHLATSDARRFLTDELTRARASR